MFSARDRNVIFDRLAGRDIEFLVQDNNLAGACFLYNKACQGKGVAMLVSNDFASGMASVRKGRVFHEIISMSGLSRDELLTLIEERNLISEKFPNLESKARVMALLPKKGPLKRTQLLWAIRRYGRISEIHRFEGIQMLSKGAMREREPELCIRDLYSAFLFYEKFIDEKRLMIEILKAAAAKGAVVLNHVTLESSQGSKGRNDVCVTDDLSGVTTKFVAEKILTYKTMDRSRLVSFQMEFPCKKVPAVSYNAISANQSDCIYLEPLQNVTRVFGSVKIDSSLSVECALIEKVTSMIEQFFDGIKLQPGEASNLEYSATENLDFPHDYRSPEVFDKSSSGLAECLNRMDSFATIDMNMEVKEYVDHRYDEARHVRISYQNFMNLFCKYGKSIELILERAFDFYGEHKNPDLAWMQAELWYMIEYEMCCKPSDALTRLGDNSQGISYTEDVVKGMFYSMSLT